MAFGNRPRPITFIRLGILLAVAIVIVVAVLSPNIRISDVDSLRERVEAFGPAAPFGVIAIQAVALLLMVPGFLLVIPTALLFGNDSIWISLAGQLSGLTLCFFMARGLGQEFFQNLLGQRLVGIEKILQEHGFRYLVFLHALTFIPLPFLSYGPGLVPMKYRNFLLASFLGIAPFVIVMGVFGESLSQVRSMADLQATQVLVPAILLVVLVSFPILVIMGWRAYQVRRAKQAAAGETADARVRP